MDAALVQSLWNAPNQVIDESTWRAIIAGLFDDFELFIGEKFERDSEVRIQCEHKAFAVWMWSRLQKTPLISLAWSGVMAGDLARDETGKDVVVVTADVFLFHEPKQKRLVTTDGKHFLQFCYKQTSPAQGEWCFVGWVRDEWGEWESLSYDST